MSRLFRLSIHSRGYFQIIKPLRAHKQMQVKAIQASSAQI